MSIQLALACSWAVIATIAALRYRAHAKKRVSKSTEAHDAAIAKHEGLLAKERERADNLVTKAQFDAEEIHRLTDDLVTAHTLSKSATEEAVEARKVTAQLVVENTQLREALDVRKAQLAEQIENKVSPKPPSKRNRK